ncbi:hypothetical protein [Micromonospora sp. WMMD1082]|uniref:hypothetical protein n=1 Tax=Micromonospora sp. WMMD1082 TaxID=3016104 RepID=UPI0024177EEC|nr:hypothetical protein [Micromonospora sp. WMMD1082]MDG4794192.1 hypothetical protein [Micromonospora sp. WMMD1082]
MTQPKTNRIPAPIYAAAGAGELALQQLRKLPAVVGELRDRVVADGGKVVNDLGGKAVVTGFELRQRASDTLRNANQTAESLRQKAAPAADLNRLRERADLAKLREAADLDKLREAADLHKLREAADLNRLREAADLDRLREVATRNAAVVVAGAHAAQERALAAYGALVARGERVVGTGVLEAADTVNADIEATEATVEPAVEPAEPAVTPEPTTAAKAVTAPSPAEVAEIAEAKPAAAKKTTRAKSTTRQPAAKRTGTPSAKLPRGTKRSQ